MIRTSVCVNHRGHPARFASAALAFFAIAFLASLAPLADGARAQELAFLRPSTLENDERYWHAAFSADGRIVLGASDKHVTLWDAATGKEIASFNARCYDNSGLAPAAMTSDGDVVAFPTENGMAHAVHVAKTDTKKSIREISLPLGFYPYALAITADGKLLAVGDSHGMVHLFDAGTGQSRGTFDAYDNNSDDEMYAMRFLPDGRRLVTTGEDDKNQTSLRIWDVATRKLVTASRWQRNAIFSFDVSADGRTLACAGWSEKGKVYSFDGQRIAVEATLPFESQIVALSRDGSTVCASWGRGVNVGDWKTDSWKLLSGTEPTSLCLHPSRDVLASTGSGEQGVRLWDLAAVRREMKPTLVRRLAWIEDRPDNNVPVDRLRFVGDKGRIAYLAGSKEFVAIRNLAEPGVLGLVEGDTLGGYIRTVDFDPSGKALIVIDKMVYEWSAPDEKPTRLLSVSEGYALAGCFSPDGSLTAVITSDRVLVMNREKEVVLKASRENRAEHCAMSRDHRWLAMAEDDDMVLLEVKSGKEIVASSDVGGRVLFSPDGRYLFGTSGAVWRMDVATGEIDRPFLQCNGIGNEASLDLAVSSSAPILAVAGGRNKLVHLWNYNTGELLVTLTGHEFPVTAVAFSPDGKTVGSGDERGFVCLWELGDEVFRRAASGPARAEGDPPAPSPDDWPNYPKTIETSRGVSIIVSPLKPTTRAEVVAAIEEALSKVRASGDDTPPSAGGPETNGQAKE